MHAGTKVSAFLRAVGSRWPVRGVVVWHVGMLKLVPFLRAWGARVALFLHGIEAWRTHRRLARRLFRRVDLFLTNSNHTWRRFVEANPEWSAAAHRTVHLGVGRPLTGPSPTPDQLPAVLVLGRLEPSGYKGHREVIAAWPRVLARMPGAQLWVAGDGELRHELEAQARALGEAGRSVTFHGAVSETEKEDLFHRCRCFAMPSRGDGFGLVYLEAMRAGRPCLVSTLDAGREVVNPPEAGLAANPRDPEELATALCRLLTPGPEWDRWSEQARRRYEQHFTAAHFQARLVGALVEAGILDG